MSNISGVTEAAGETGAAAEVKQAAGDLSSQPAALKDEIEKFIANIEAA